MIAKYYRGVTIKKKIGGHRLLIKLDIIKQHGSYIVRRVDGEYQMHAHLSTYSGCKLLIDCIKRNKLPKSKYLIGSCKRLLTPEEYKRLRPSKQIYYNINKGVR